MPSTPTTKSQVQAYRFVLRRMQSALVRKDAVMLHDPMRTHSRATIVGVCLAALGLLGFLIWGILSPKPTVPTKDGIVIGKPSGQVYVLLTKPTKRMIPVFNLASARLLLYSQSLGDEDDQVSQGVGGPGTGGPAQVFEPTVVDDNELRDQIPRSRKVGIADGPDLLPSKDQRIDNQWTVCDQYKLDKDLNDPARDDKVETTVIAGVSDRGDELRENESLLVEAENGDDYLVYRTPGTANLPNTNTVRAKVDLDDRVIRAALQVEDDQVRNITTGLLNAIPEKTALVPPKIDGAGEKPQSGAPGDLEVGSVFSVERAGQEPVFYVVEKNGIEKIKQTTADLIRYRQDINSGGIPKLSPQDVTESNVVDGGIDDSTFPKQQTEILKPENLPVTCLGWQTNGSGEDEVERTSVHVGKVVPGIPKDEQDNPKWVDISTPGSTGIRIQHFYMPPGRGAVVRQATSPADFKTGGIALVSDRGVKYGVPDGNTAAALGLADQLPAPDNILVLLPDGASLDPRDVEQSYDTVPVEGGEYPTNTDDPNGDGAQSGGN
ncbi:MAG TPA: type VII secretion protein EccB [Actinophytocola sp.]|jgi:type VII secretion protein EccB|nr:type VII secretion protein EccB [Actinophytocola sp.]